MIERRSGFRTVHRFDPEEKIVSMLIFNERLMVATNEGLYRVKIEVDSFGNEISTTLEKIELVKELKDDGRPNAE